PFLTDDEDGWLALTDAPQLVEKGNSETRKFYEKLINEMFNMNQDKYPEDFYSALMDLRDFVLGRDSLRFDLVIQYLYFTAGNDNELKKTEKAYSLASAIILSTAAKRKEVTLGQSNEFITNDENGYDSSQRQHISLNKDGKDTMNFIGLNHINGIIKWDGKDALSNYYNTKVLGSTTNRIEPCSFYTLLHECVHVLYYIKPDLSVIDMTQPNRCAGCLLKSQLNVEDLNPNSKDKDYAKKLAVLNEYRYFRKQVINLYFKKLNYDMAIKVENYFRVNLRKLDNSSENIFVRTSIGHLGTIINQEHIEGYYKKDCFKQWWDKKKGTYPSFFMDINEKLYTLTDDILQALDIMYISAITNNNGSKNGKIHRIVFTNGIEGLKKYNYWKDKYEGLKYKNIWKLE
ncbi:MAG: hypothetical protein J6X26_01880, partial [Bacteroidales bacterium]|nr:hypothetical protein [Bacteroidales bacterium]